MAVFLPDTRTLLVVAPFAFAAAWLAGRAAISLRRRGTSPPYTRKVFHFVIFTFAAVVQFWHGPAGVVTFGAVVASVVLLAVLRGYDSALFDALARPSDSPRERWFVVAPLASTAVGGVVSNLLFGPFAVVGYLVAGWGDAIAEPVGERWGRHRYRSPSMFGVRATRSLEGSIAVFTVGAIGALVALLASSMTLVHAGAAALAAGFAGALIEAVSTHGLDNLTVQVGASGIAYFVIMVLFNVAMV